MTISPPIRSAKREARSPKACLALGLILFFCSIPCVILAQERADGSDFILVTEESWKLGEVRSYTLLFDQVPFGRETIRLLELQGEKQDRRLKFSQTLTMDLRAVGQRGFLTLFSTVRYTKGKTATTYRLEALLRERSDYSTYPKSPDPENRTLLDLELPGASPRMTWEGGGERREIPLPPTAGAMLVDPLSMGHWERLFLGDTWKVGETRRVDVLLPTGPARFDYHLRSFQPAPPRPLRTALNVTVEARETVEIFSVPIPAFRCRIPELGLVLWVSSNGGILKYDDGRGLVVTLER